MTPIEQAALWAELDELATHHHKQAVHFEPFGAQNVLTVFHRKAADTCIAASAALASLEAAKKEPHSQFKFRAWYWYDDREGYWDYTDDPDSRPGQKWEPNPLYAAAPSPGSGT